MKKLLIISIMSTLMLVGCSEIESGNSTNKQDSMNRDRDTIFEVVEKIGRWEYVVKDNKTGCYYIQSVGGQDTYTYSPYLGEDGKVMGCGQKDFKY